MGLDVDEQPGAVLRKCVSDRRHHLCWVRHVVDAVEGGHEVDRVVRWKRGDAWVGEGRVGEPGLLEAFVRSGQGICADVVTDEGAVRKGSSHQQDRTAGAATDVGDGDPTTKRVDESAEARQDVVDEVGIRPRLEAALDPDGAFRAVAVVVVAESRAETLRHSRDGVHGLWETVEHSHAERWVLVVGEDRTLFWAEEERVVADRRRCAWRAGETDQLC